MLEFLFVLVWCACKVLIMIIVLSVSLDACLSFEKNSFGFEKEVIREFFEVLYLVMACLLYYCAWF